MLLYNSDLNSVMGYLNSESTYSKGEFSILFLNTIKEMQQVDLYLLVNLVKYSRYNLWTKMAYYSADMTCSVVNTFK